jgi:hypothetical protein
MLKLSDQAVALAYRDAFADTRHRRHAVRIHGGADVVLESDGPRLLPQSCRRSVRAVVSPSKGYPGRISRVDTNALLRSSFKEMIDALRGNAARDADQRRRADSSICPKSLAAIEILVQHAGRSAEHGGQARGEATGAAACER